MGSISQAPTREGMGQDLGVEFEIIDFHEAIVQGFHVTAESKYTA